MAKFTDINRKLTILLNDGASATGGQRTKSRTYSGLSETASAANVLKAGKALGSLMENDVLGVYVNDKNEVVLDEGDLNA